MKIKDLVFETFYWKNKNKIYSLLIDTIDSGPFDGGCVVFAQALQILYGGKIVVLVSNRNIAEHAAVLIDDVLYDADGPDKIKEFIERFEKNELRGTNRYITGIRQLSASDLPEAPRNLDLSKQIAKLLQNRE